MLQNIQVKELHFAWDMQRQERAVLAGLRRYLESDPHKRARSLRNRVYADELRHRTRL